MRLCPICHKADACTTESRAVASLIILAVAVTLPEKLCGRCALVVADAALLAAHKQLLVMRELQK